MKTILITVIAAALVLAPAITAEAKSKPPVKSPTSRTLTLPHCPAFQGR